MEDRLRHVPAAPGSSLAVLGAAQVVTPVGSGPRAGRAQGELTVIEDGGVVVRDGRITAIGSTDALIELARVPGCELIDARGKVVLPGLVDCHTHTLFGGGPRVDEYAERLAGVPPADIAARGGGMRHTVEATAAASDEALVAAAVLQLDAMAAHGTGTVEVKSGYGAGTADELRQLRLVRELGSGARPDVVPTFLGAHAVPSSWRSDPQGYVDLVANEMLPAVQREALAAVCDVTCEPGYFTPAQCAALLRRARELGFALRVHADAFAESTGWELAVSHGALAADHLTYTSERAIRAAGSTGTVAVLLPGAELVYLLDRRASARTFVDAGVPVAISTDFGPGIHVPYLAAMLPLAAAWLRLTPEETITAATLNAAAALGLATDRGSLEPGKRADLVIFDVPDYRWLVYEHGLDRVWRTILATPSAAAAA